MRKWWIAAVLLLVVLGAGCWYLLDAGHQHELVGGVAGVANYEREAQNRVGVLLTGMDMEMFGSIGYSISVNARHAERARAILREAIAKEGLQITVYEKVK